MEIKAVYNNLLIQLDPEENKTAGGLFLSDKVKPDVVTGKILSSGTGIPSTSGLIPMMVSVGDTVTFRRGSGVKVDEVRVIIKDHDVLGVVLGKESN